MDYQLWLGDCLEEMDRIEDGSIDMICADLPYGTTHCAWDSVIPLEPLWKQCKRVIKKNGAIVLTAKQPFTTVLAYSNLKWFRYELIWKKTNGGEFLNANRKPLPRHENILIFYKGLPTYNPQFTEGKPYACTSAGVGATTADLSVIGWTTINDGKRYPVSVLEFQNDKGLHPTQKPAKLIEYLVRTFTNPNDLVLDNTFGSCTTGEACLRTGRRFIGIEKDANYFEIGKARMERVAADLRGELNHLPMFQEIAA